MWFQYDICQCMIKFLKYYFLTIKKDEKIKETIWYIPYKFIFEKHCIRKAMSQKKHQLCFVVPKEKGCSVHLFGKNWLNDKFAKIREFPGLRPLNPAQQGFAPDPMGPYGSLRPLWFLAYTSFQAWLRPCLQISIRIFLSLNGSRKRFRNTSLQFLRLSMQHFDSV